MAVCFHRRDFLALSAAIAAPALAPLRAAETGQVRRIADADRIRGLLLGSMIGDALGGPIEFQASASVTDHVLNCRAWPDTRAVTENDLREFGQSLKLMPYERFRPETEAYGQWQTNAPAGTVTDDTRHKMVLINALRDAQANARLPLTQQDLARAYLQFADTPAIVSRSQYGDLCEESFREFAKAAHWVLGNRHLEQAAPPDRIWGGVPTCCGQMTMLPLAALYAGRPEDAYRATYELSFFDVGPAKDINAALVAGLSVALVQPKPTNEQSRQAVWHNITTAMRTTDPYQYDQIPFVTRPIVQWLDFASEVARDATDRPKRLYERLLRDGQVQYFWESHFIVALVFSTLEFCNYDPLAALAMILDFGHDTDSGAQLLGALAGAIHGPNLFAQELQKPVLAQLDADYDVSLEEWVALLDEVGKA